MKKGRQDRIAETLTDLIHDEEQVKGRLFTYKLLVYRPYRRKVNEVEGLDVL